MGNVRFALILITLYCSTVAGENQLEDRNRTCVTAEAEPFLNSSSCYPLVNFSRPFFQNHGVTLPSYVYATPSEQTDYNDRAHLNSFINLDPSKASEYFKMDIPFIKKCVKNVIILLCRMYVPSCDSTKNVFRKTKVCRESCLEFIDSCGPAWKLFEKYIKARYPHNIEKNKQAHCELQPYRNSGDSPECWYYNGHANITDTTLALELPSKADCLYLNGSNYHGNKSVTASGIPCQSWTEQCPHRHTMNTTYPELNNAENFCRNPQNSGKRPWCFTTDRTRRWEYCDIPKCVPVNGGYSNWSVNSTCNATCGQGFETWFRRCNNPEPKYGGRNCSHLGKYFVLKRCSAKSCPVNGGYGNWSLSIACNVSCGYGVETWQRTCDNPVPKYGGQNCSELGKSTETRNCSRKPCPITCNCGNWTKFAPCNVTCGQGMEIWTRKCDIPPDGKSGNCSKQGVDKETRSCKMKICPVRVNFENIGIIVGVLFAVVAIVVFFILIRRRRNKEFPHYAVLNFSLTNLFVRNREQLENNGNSSEEVASSSQETGSPNEYENTLSDGTPVPAQTRGIVPYERDYKNTSLSWYDKLQTIRPLAIDWLRNTWGNIDEFGRHVYDTIKRIPHIFATYDKIRNAARDDLNENGATSSSNTYDNMERLPPVTLPSRRESVLSATENV